MKVFSLFFFFSGHYKELRLRWSRVEWAQVHCSAVHGIAEACLEIWFTLTALIGWCGRLSVHESSFSVYGPTRRLELPDGDSPHSY